VLCSKCATSLPDGSRFCLKCGQPASTPPARDSSPSLVDAVLACSKCGTPLPEEAEFCLKCGKAVSLPARGQTVIEALPPVVAAKPRRSPRKILLWTLFAVIVFGLIPWLVIDDGPFAQGFQELLGWKHDQAILDTPFSVGPHTFRYYKFSLPEGSVNVAAVGQFTSAEDSSNARGRKASDKKDKEKDKDKDADNIEVYVLTEAAFTVWQNGYATSSVYESGRVAQGTVQADVPAGAGIYYLVFNNKFSPNTPKAVHAVVLLRYKSWMPDWIRRIKGRLSNWTGPLENSPDSP
jgi:ribosomal protein L40E